MAFVEIIGQQPLVEVTPSEPAEVTITPGGNIRMNVVIVNNVPTTVSVTASQGIKGADGAPGPTGPAGPNQVTISTATNITGILKGNGTNVQQAVAGTDYGTVSSVGITAGTGISVSGTNPVTGSGSITVTNSAPDQVVGLSAGTGISVTGTYPNFTIANTQTSAQWGNITGTLSSQTDLQNALNAKQDDITLTTSGNSGAATFIGNTLNIPQYTDQFTGTVTSVGLSMPSAFTVSNSPVIGSGTINVVGAGTTSQYVRGDGQLATLPSSPSGGGASISYYLNGSVNASVATYKQLSKNPVIGTGTNFSTSSNGLIAQFLTDAGDPNILNIPGGNWLLDFYFNASSAGGTPNFYVELYKYDGTTFTLIASNSATPEFITNGTAIDFYTTSISVPTTALTLTDRLAIRVYVACDGRTITLHTEGVNLSQILTTFSTGLSALNGLIAQVQSLATGTSGTDFNINSATATHTFNLPVASATNTGKLSSTDWGTFDAKPNGYYQNSTPTGTIPLESIWIHSDTGIQYNYINDGNGNQWVQSTLPLGPQGPQGANGTNVVNSSTATTFTGLLKGNGSVVSATTVATELGFTPENVANKENVTLDSSSTKYPTNNLVKTNLDNFADDVDYAIMTNQRLLFNF